VLSEALAGELKDPRIGFVTVTGGRDVRTTLRARPVFVSVLRPQRKAAASLEGLAAALGVLQARVARELRNEADPLLLVIEYDRTWRRAFANEQADRPTLAAGD
jgi:ribosome-binding factor A